MWRPEDYDYDLPPEQIAQQPLPERRSSRMLVLQGEGDPLHERVDALPRVLAEHELRPLIVINDSRVVPARIHAQREGAEATGRGFELLICDPAPLEPGDELRAWVRGAKKLRPGDRLVLGGSGAEQVVVAYRGPAPVDSRARIFALLEGDLLTLLEREGELPLPPYVQRETGPTASDRERYQTVYARERGSVAAPTAGLHLDPGLLAALDVVAITLHVGPGTFLPMDAADVRAHRVGVERYEIAHSAAERIAAARSAGRPILAVGTTVTRTLESVAAAHEGAIEPGRGTTDLVITPEHRFRCVDMLLTNFHLPRSSLLMLVCSFAGHERVLSAYREAVREGYRFFSYGDCMLGAAKHRPDLLG